MTIKKSIKINQKEFKKVLTINQIWFIIYLQDKENGGKRNESNDY
jgi:hypothetical protein